jgi:hypothetical protein
MRALCTTAMSMCFMATSSTAQVGTASLVGRVVDITGAGVAATQVDLRSETGPSQRLVADNSGKFRFAALIAGEYTLAMQQVGFLHLIVKQISISDGEEKVLPALRMDVGQLGCSPHALVEYCRLEQHQGSLAGTVRLDRGPLRANGPLINGAKITLVCNQGRVCGATTTNSHGEFFLRNLAAGNYSIRVNHAGFYPVLKLNYEVRDNLESIYYPMYLEQCPRGNCDPMHRPKKPAAICE